MIRHVRRGISKVWATISLMGIELIAVVLTFLFSLSLFVFLIKLVFADKDTWLDDRAFEFMALYTNEFNTGVMEIFSFLGSHYFLITANIFMSAFFLFIVKHRWYSIKVPVISLSSVMLMFLLKQFFHRERPLIPLLAPAKGMSFPSGHSLMSFAFYGLMIYLIWKNVKHKTIRWVSCIVLAFVIFFIGFSRIYLKVHFASDVLAGFSLGMVWLTLSVFFLTRMEKIGRKQIDPNVEKDTSDLQPETLKT